LNVLWRHADFLKLWAGQTVSLFGSLVGRFVLPLVAAITLEVSPLEMAFLRSAPIAAGVVVALAAGVWVDRLRRRPIMIWADLGRAGLLATIPIASLYGQLRIEQLFVVAVLVGVLSTFFDVAYRAYLPTLLRREELVEGNAKLQTTGAIAEVASFGMAGAIVQALTAPVALAIDCASFVVSAISLAMIGRAEPPAPPSARQSLWREAREGMAVLAREPVLRALAAAKLSHELCLNVAVAVLTLYLLRDLLIDPLQMGLLYAVGGVTALAGALYAERAVARWGIGPCLIGGLLFSSATFSLLPAAAGPVWLVLVMVGAQQLGDAPAVVYEVAEASLVQGAVPERLQGRVNASFRFLGWAAALGGLLIGGLLGETIGLRATMAVGSVGMLLATLWLVRSPIPRLREIPEPVIG
jgi:MFS family permease